MDANELANRVAHAMLAAEGTGPAWGIRIEEARAGYARLSMIVRADSSGVSCSVSQTISGFSGGS